MERWPEQHTQQLIDYMARHNIRTETQILAESWEGLMLDYSEAAITAKALRILQTQIEEARISHIFDTQEEYTSVRNRIHTLRLEGKTNEEVLDLAKPKFPNLELRDITRIAIEKYKQDWYGIATLLNISNPKEPRDFRHFMSVYKIYGSGITQFNKGKLTRMVIDG